MGSSGRGGSAGDEGYVAPRFDLCVPVAYRGPGFEGEGLLGDISSSGARIERASNGVAPGTKLGMRFSFFVGSFARELPAEAVRETESGFAVRFVELKAEDRRLLERALSPLKW